MNGLKPIFAGILLFVGAHCAFASPNYHDANPDCAVQEEATVGEDTPHFHHHALLKKAAAEGNTEAQNSIGLMYFQGNGVLRDYREAVKWFRLASANGSSAAMNNLGFAYQRGHGVPKNAKKAFMWTWRAAHTENANNNAINHLGQLFEEGVGTPKDFARAASLYEIAAKGGSANAMNHLVSMYRSDKEHLGQVIAMFRQEGESGDRNFQEFLGSMYMYGQGVQADYAQAIKWFLLAAEQESTYAASNLGAIYLQGLGVPKDLQKARSYLMVAADQGDTVSVYNLGVMYRDAEGVTEDDDRAMEYFLSAAKDGYVPAVLNAGLLYQKMRDYPRALKYLKIAVGADSIELSDKQEGLIALAHMFKESQGVNRSDFLAYALADFAADPQSDAIKAELVKSMSDKEISFAKHLAVELRQGRATAHTINAYQTLPPKN